MPTVSQSKPESQDNAKTAPKQKEFPSFVCKNGHKHTEAIGGVGLLAARVRKLADGEMEILVRKKYDLSIPEPPSWHAMPSASRECGELAEDCIARGVFTEMGLPIEAFHFTPKDIYMPENFKQKATIVLAVPAAKMGPHVGHHYGHQYSWVLVSEIKMLEICPGYRIDNQYVRTLLGLLPERPKTSLLKRTLRLK